MAQAQGASKYATKLAKMKGGFVQAERQAKIFEGSETYPQAIYQGKVTAKLKESESSGNLMVSRMFVPTEGELQGLPCFDNLVIEHENPMVEMRNMRTLVRFLDLCGYEFDTDSPETLEEILEQLTKEAPIVQFEVKHSGTNTQGQPYINVDVLKLVAEGESTQTADAANAPGSEGSGQTPPLAEFCDAQEIPYNDDEDDDILKARIEAHVEENGKFKQDKLTAEEVELLAAYELGDMVEQEEQEPVPPPARRRPVVPPPARKRVAAPAPKAKAKVGKAPARRGR